MVVCHKLASQVQGQVQPEYDGVHNNISKV